ncbi:hypothetical protein B0O99DRAFT_615427 [Bisporella sp. PMI_857]|nr:hypothetical protein B0O99DRAFT_615427 [Bisporella sp. PMI_857]
MIRMYRWLRVPFSVMLGDCYGQAAEVVYCNSSGDCNLAASFCTADRERARPLRPF